MMDRKWRILIIDDEFNNLQLMRQILEDRYQLAFATNGSKALEIAQKLETDLILLDIMMPDMDGYEVCRQLKADEKTKNIPIIFVTAKDEVEDETKGLKIGAIDYITKPISPSIVRLTNHLELKNAREKIEKQKKKFEDQNKQLIEAALFREDIERITSRDLKNPLKPIISSAENLISDSRLAKDQIESAMKIKEFGYEMLRMISQSLDLFRMEKGLYQCKPDKTDILPVINEIINQTQGIMKAKHLSAKVFTGENGAGESDTFFVMGEEMLCYSMLLNLFKNAVEASPDNEQITISLDKNDMSAIHIHNKGTVPENIREHFFDKYLGGTGLGTYSAKLAAEMQGSSIRFDTSDEKGTTVTVMMKNAE
ncbi:MAG: hybrid sensor histidine kinase/response regulator [Desulfobacterales bacterium]|nr:hybrid sensor histidine kinase/response regulator [Desulfobacterales bacterium]